jgi:hypothetical protein
MENSEEITKKMEDIEKQKELLEKQRQELMVKEGKAYNCKKCKAFCDNEKASPSPLEQGLCSNCWNKNWRIEQYNEILKKLKYARIIDVKIEGSTEIVKIKVYKNGMIYDLKAEYDRDFDDNANIVIDSEEKDRGQLELDEEELKPWMKERQEKPLVK